MTDEVKDEELKVHELEDGSVAVGDKPEPDSEG